MLWSSTMDSKANEGQQTTDSQLVGDMIGSATPDANGAPQGESERKRRAMEVTMRADCVCSTDLALSISRHVYATAQRPHTIHQPRMDQPGLVRMSRLPIDSMLTASSLNRHSMPRRQQQEVTQRLCLVSSGRDRRLLPSSKTSSGEDPCPEVRMIPLRVSQSTPMRLIQNPLWTL